MILICSMCVNPFPCSKLALALAVTIASSDVLSCVASDKKSSTTASPTNAVPAIATVEIPQSIFVIPSNPKEGRNPFFPQARVEAPVAKPNTPTDITSFFLNGITSPPKRTAMINGVTFEPGEEHEIKRIDGSKAMVKCEEIRADSAIISVGGMRKELRLRQGL